VTNGSRSQLHTIQALGLDSRTPCILVSELVGCRKPDAAIFAAAAARLGVPPGAVLFVGDNPEADVWGAHRAGMRTAWLQRGPAWPATISERCADLTIGSLNELVGLVGRAIDVRCRKGCACSTLSSLPFARKVAPLVTQRLRSHGRFARKVVPVFNSMHNGMRRPAETRFLR